MVVLIGVIVSVMCVFLLRMYTLAAVSPDERAVADADSMTYQTTVEGARGCILDRNGNVLVSNRATYNIVIINYVLANTGAPNENILKLLQMCQQLGIECQSHFPVTKTKPYEYDMQSLNTTWQNYFRMFLNNRDYDLDISASTLMRNLREAYRIPNDWDADDVYNVIAVRYELELRSVDNTGLENYMLAKDVDAESLAAVAELGIPGVIIQSGTVRAERLEAPGQARTRAARRHRNRRLLLYGADSADSAADYEASDQRGRPQDQDGSGAFQIVQRPLHCARREVQVAGYRLDARPAAPAACTVTEVHIDCPRPVRQVGIGIDGAEEAHFSA